MKKFILNADNFGKNQDYNRAVLNGYNNGFLKSASLIANGESFETAVNEILPECQNLSVGVHLNLTSGKALTGCPLLTDLNGNFCNNFSKLEKLSGKKDILNEIETELRAQIERVKSRIKVTHIDSVSNIHIIPEIFNLTCKLAKEYEIPYIRNAYEEFYIVPKIGYFINLRFFANILQLIKLNIYSKRNIQTLKSYNLLSNNYYIGTTYNKMMDSKTLEYGLKNIADEDDIIVETSITPCSYLRNINDYQSKEFKLTQDKILEDNINRMGFDIKGHKV